MKCGHVPEDDHRDGLVLEMISISENIALQTYTEPLSKKEI